MPRSALDELLQHTAALRHLARDLVGEAHADDVLQETAIQAMAVPPARPGAAMGWLTTVVRHLASKHRRAARVRLRHEQGAARSEVLPVDRSVEDADTLRRLTEIVTTLPEPYRGTILARYLRDRSPSEIAAESGEPVRTVKTRLQRGLRLLRERLAERGADWRAALCGAFGLDAAGAPVAAVSAAAGILLMTTTTKFVLATAVLLLASVITWQFVGPGAPLRDERAQVPESAAAASAPPLSSVGNETPARVEAPAVAVLPQAVDVGVAVRGDEIVVRAVDAATGVAVERFGLRTVIAPNQNMLASENPLLHEGQHADGRLVLPAADFDQRTFQLEDSEHRYLASPWFTLADVAEQGGQRTIEVKLPLPVEVTLTVVREHGGAPIAGTKVELVRPWINSPETTMHTNVQPAERFRAQPGETEMIMKFLGGRAMLLSGGETDAAGRIHLRVPPDEPLALRLLGPGHQPVVRQPWRVPASAKPVDVVEAVTSGGTIQGRVVPMDALRRWSPELPKVEDSRVAPQLFQASLATGLRLRHKVTGETAPPAKMPFNPRAPLAADGTFAIDGLTAGDWQVFFGYALRVQELEVDPRFAAQLAAQPGSFLIGLETMEVELPAIEGLTDHELRVIDVDVSNLAPGQLDAAVTRDGRIVGAGALLVAPIAENGAPLPIFRSSPNLRFGKKDRIVATLPPARYAARWFRDGAAANNPLEDFEIRSGVTTRVDFVIDTVPASWRVVEADGSTPASGKLSVRREGRLESPIVESAVDAAGLVEFAELPRDAVLRATFYRTSPPVAAGTIPPQGTPIDLGTVTSGGAQGTPLVLELPPR